ncbi:MAG TPA: alpha/beta-hydrolase family protein [Kineosporiaceae bacterium]|nr:alpha/beta-hydrolase family protein [Kineosporiaceae bacterium]
MDHRVGDQPPADAEAASEPAVGRAGTLIARPPAQEPLRSLGSRCRTLPGAAERLLTRAADWLLVSGPGVVIGVLFFCVSLTPSLLPRTWLAQGAISGIATSTGYGIGALLGWCWSRLLRGGLRFRRGVRDLLREEVRRLLRRRFSESVHRTVARVAQRLLIGATLVLVTASVVQGSLWQRDLYLRMGQQPPGRLGYLRVPIVAVLLLAISIGVVRALRGAVRRLIERLRSVIPAGPLQALGVSAGVVIVVGVIEGITLGGFLSAASRISAVVNEAQGTAAPPPRSVERSGGPQSLVTWASLGREGRLFIGGGPTLDQLRAFDGPKAREPIRVYVGLQSPPTAAATAALAVRELERTGAFSRSVLCVVTTTGTGWVDPYLAAALEYVHSGDTAIVGVQYSSLPSWISFLTERERVQQAGRELFDQVYARWSQLPAGHRPQLLVFGESLGALGSEAAFADLDDLRARAGGVLWAGPTNANRLWSGWTAHRDPGSPEVLPIYQNGRTVRFVSQPDDLARPATAWPTPRVVYLQNPSDPVTWWSPSLWWKRPDWLEERRGRDVLPVMRWFPVVTFLQVSADLGLAYGAPPGHGHRFHGPAVSAWAAISSPAGWTPERSAALTRLLGR